MRIIIKTEINIANIIKLWKKLHLSQKHAYKEADKIRHVRLILIINNN